MQQINEVKRAMQAGRVVVLVNHDQIYEALYDVLNQRFIRWVCLIFSSLCFFQ